jgi:hypothetical protein
MSEKNLKSEIKKRRGWDRIIKPRAPTKPKEPPKTITERVSYKYLGEKTLYDCAMFSLKELLRENIPTETIHLEFKKPYSDDDDFALELYSIVEQEKENPNYNKQIKAYEKALAKYQEDYKAYKQEVKEWKLWVKQEEVKEFQIRLEEAKKFVQMHEAKK